MKLDELLAATPKPQNADDMLNGLQMLMTADDIDANEKSAVATGFLIGCTFALAAFNEGNIKKAAQALIQLKGEWEAHDII